MRCIDEGPQHQPAPALGDRWDEMLDLVEFAINNAVNRSTGFTPFQLMQGGHPRTPLGSFKPSDDEPPPDAAALNFFLTQQAVLESARRHTIDAMAAGADSFDRSRPPAPAYKVGDTAWLSSAPLAT